jgi:hypothetical protein
MTVRCTRYGVFRPNARLHRGSGVIFDPIPSVSDPSIALFKEAFERLRQGELVAGAVIMMASPGDHGSGSTSDARAKRQ